MNADLMRLFGRLGNQVSSKLIYFFLIYQIVGTLLVLFLDSGFPPIIIIAGWIILFLIILVRIISKSKIELREEQKSQNEQRRMMQLVSKIKKHLSLDPNFRTSCSSCRYFNRENRICLKRVPNWANPFKFHVQDEQTYCLYWYSKDEPEKGSTDFRDF